METKVEKHELTELKLTLEEPEAGYFNFHKGSLLQGVLFERLDPAYAEQLHEQGLKPYSQCIRTEGDRAIWYVRTLSEEAYQKILLPLQAETFQAFEIEHDQKQIKIIEKEQHETTIDALLQNFYSEEAGRVMDLEFLSPTAFKKDGAYRFYPEMIHIYQSLMRKFDAVSPRAMFSEETLEQLAKNAEIVDYRLRSTRFSLEHVRIPAFTGRVRVKLHGPQTMVNFARLLFEFGNYSGVGIKTSIGMGYIRFSEPRRAQNDKTGN